MAIKLKKTLSNGVTGDYWRITHYVENFDKNVAEGSIALYVSKDYRDKEKESGQNFVIYTQSYSVPIEMITTIEARESVYEYLKNNDLIDGEEV